MVRILGYFPGVDFVSDDQYGRRTHVREFIEFVHRSEGHSGKFIVGERGSDDPFVDMPAVETISLGTGEVTQFLGEFLRAIHILGLVSKSAVDALYARNSPYFAPVLISFLTDLPVVIEANGVPEEEGHATTTQELQNKLYNRLRKLGRERADIIVAVSKSVKETLERENPNYDIVVVQNGVDTGRFDIEREVSTAPPYTIAYVGGLQEWQGIEKMLSVLRYVETAYQFNIVGGTGQRREEIQELVREYGLEERVSLVGRVPHEEVPTYINEADLCFGPFVRNRKASPIKIFEYVACGRSVVYVNDTGIDEPGDLPGVHRLGFVEDTELAGEIDRILGGVRTNEDGRAAIVSDFSWESSVRESLELCETLSSRRSSRR